jgi:hypothetical protein
MKVSKTSASVSFARMWSWLVARELEVVARGLHARLEPVALLGVLELRELDADGAAVGLLEARHDLAQRQRCAIALKGDRRGRRRPGRRSLEAELAGDRAVRAAAREDVERVEIREEVAAHAVRVDHRGHAALELGRETTRRGDARRRAARRQRLLVEAVEVLAPGLAHGGGVRAVLEVQLFDEALVDAEILAHGWLLPLRRPLTSRPSGPAS